MKVLQRGFLVKKIKEYFRKKPKAKSVIIESNANGSKMAWKVVKSGKSFHVTEVTVGKQEFILEADGDKTAVGGKTSRKKDPKDPPEESPDDIRSSPNLVPLRPRQDPKDRSKQVSSNPARDAASKVQRHGQLGAMFGGSQPPPAGSQTMAPMPGTSVPVAPLQPMQQQPAQQQQQPARPFAAGLSGLKPLPGATSDLGYEQNRAAWHPVIQGLDRKGLETKFGQIPPGINSGKDLLKNKDAFMSVLSAWEKANPRRESFVVNGVLIREVEEDQKKNVKRDILHRKAAIKAQDEQEKSNATPEDETGIETGADLDGTDTEVDTPREKTQEERALARSLQGQTIKSAGIELLPEGGILTIETVSLSTPIEFEWKNDGKVIYRFKGRPYILRRK